jgi:hypothetical protein
LICHNHFGCISILLKVPGEWDGVEETKDEIHQKLNTRSIKTTG